MHLRVVDDDAAAQCCPNNIVSLCVCSGAVWNGMLPTQSYLTGSSK